MAIDLNQADQQKEGNFQTIPPKSKVWVTLGITYPEQYRAAAQDPTLTQSDKSSLCYLATILTVSTGTYAGKKIYHNFNLMGATTQGQQQAIDISMRQIRALVEVARGVKPSDASPQASQARQLNAWSDLNGLSFPIEVGCQDSKPSSKNGKIYSNNVMRKVVTMEDADFEMLRQTGEKISAEPIPEPKQPAAEKQAAWGSGSNAAQPWAVPPSESADTQLAPTQKPQAAAPAWATPQTPPPPPQQTPAYDRTPF